jgi:hypothetical protein
MGQTPLRLGCSKVDIVILLLAKGAFPYTVDKVRKFIYATLRFTMRPVRTITLRWT